MKVKVEIEVFKVSEDPFFTDLVRNRLVNLIDSLAMVNMYSEVRYREEDDEANICFGEESIGRWRYLK